MSLCPIVSCAWLSKHKVIWSEDGSIWSSSHGIHGAGLQVKKDGSGNIFAGASLVVVDINSLQLEVWCALIITIWVDAMLIRDDFPEL